MLRFSTTSLNVEARSNRPIMLEYPFPLHFKQPLTGRWATFPES